MNQPEQTAAEMNDSAAREAFRKADEQESMRHHTSWQCWREGWIAAEREALRENQLEKIVHEGMVLVSEEDAKLLQEIRDSEARREEAAKQFQKPTGSAKKSPKPKKSMFCFVRIVFRDKKTNEDFHVCGGVIEADKGDAAWDGIPAFGGETKFFLERLDDTHNVIDSKAISEETCKSMTGRSISQLVSGGRKSIPKKSKKPAETTS